MGCNVFVAPHFVLGGTMSQPYYNVSEVSFWCRYGEGAVPPTVTSRSVFLPIQDNGRKQCGTDAS